MAEAIIAIFTSENEARRAREALSSAGFDSTNVQDAVSDGSDGSDERGVGGFFRSLFGSDDHRHVGDYGEALRRGHPVSMGHVTWPFVRIIARAPARRGLESSARAIGTTFRADSR